MDNPRQMSEGTYKLIGSKILRAGRYDDDGELVEVVEADSNGRITLPTSGLWWIKVESK
jgi:hypothetical protein